MSKKKILMVDDDHAVTDYLTLKLSKDYDVVVVNDSTTVVGVARREQPDLVLCDIAMPGMDGGDVCRALAEDGQTRHIPFVYLTSLVSAEEARTMNGLFGGKHGISKHGSIEESLARIKTIIAG